MSRHVYLIEGWGEEKQTIQISESAIDEAAFASVSSSSLIISTGTAVGDSVLGACALHVSLKQGNRGDHGVLHEYFSWQMEKEGREAAVIKVEIERGREIKSETPHTADPKTTNDSI